MSRKRFPAITTAHPLRAIQSGWPRRFKEFPMIVPDHQWIQIKRRSYNTVRTLIHRNLAQPSDCLLSGVQDAGTWKLTAQAEVAILSDECLSIAGQAVAAQLSHLPMHIYRSLVAGSAMFTQYEGLDALYRQVRQPLEGWNAAEFARLLEETVRAGRRPDGQPRLVVPTTYTAQWRSDQIYLRQSTKGDWFLALIFDAQYLPGPRHAVPVPVGLDLGLNPLTVACTGAGELQTFHSCTLDHLWEVTRLNLTSRAQSLLERLAYASGREDAQQVIAYLNWRASRVYAEKLRLHGMNLGYVQEARALAIHDHHFSHLPQSMYAAGMFFKRVPPYYTSQRCAYCYTQANTEVYGNRHGHLLTCHNCKQTFNCHEVAAWNVLITGEELYSSVRRR